MWFRFFYISAAKWLTSFFATILLLRFIIPGAVSGFWISIPVWVLAFLIAFLFANWAFSKQLPDQRSVIMLCVVWAVVYVTGYLLYGITYSLIGPWIIVTYQVIIQLVIEILAVLLAAYRTRRMKLKAVVGEGMTL